MLFKTKVALFKHAFGSDLANGLELLTHVPDCSTLMGISWSGDTC